MSGKAGQNEPARLLFTLTYRPCSQNKKADTLSRLYETEERPMDQTPILPASCLVAPVMWDLDADIEQALCTEPAPLQCPVGAYVRSVCCP